MPSGSECGSFASSVPLPGCSGFPHSAYPFLLSQKVQMDMGQSFGSGRSLQSPHQRVPSGTLHCQQKDKWKFFFSHLPVSAHRFPRRSQNSGSALPLQAGRRSPRSGSVRQIPDPGKTLPLLLWRKCIRRSGGLTVLSPGRGGRNPCLPSHRLQKDSQ